MFSCLNVEFTTCSKNKSPKTQNKRQPDVPRKSLIRSSLSSLQVLAELLTVPLISRFSRQRSFAPPRSPIVSTRSRSDRSVFWVPPRSLNGELSRVLRPSPWSAANSTPRSRSARSVIGGNPRELRSLTGELSRVLSSPECLRRLRSFTESTETLDTKPVGCNFCSLEVGAVTSTVASFAGNKFCTTILLIAHHHIFVWRKFPRHHISWYIKK